MLFRSEGDRVAARLTTTARHTGTFMGLEGTGSRYSIDEIHVFRIRDGQCVEHWHAFDTMDLMRQLKGASGAPGSSSGASGSTNSQIDTPGN